MQTLITKQMVLKKPAAVCSYIQKNGQALWDAISKSKLCFITMDGAVSEQRIDSRENQVCLRIQTSLLFVKLMFIL